MGGDAQSAKLPPGNLAPSASRSPFRNAFAGEEVVLMLDLESLTTAEMSVVIGILVLS